MFYTACLHLRKAGSSACMPRRAQRGVAALCRGAGRRGARGARRGGRLRLAFRKGALVGALRAGDWVLLDEINLAPSEVASCPACSGTSLSWPLS